MLESASAVFLRFQTPRDRGKNVEECVVGSWNHSAGVMISAEPLTFESLNLDMNASPTVYVSFLNLKNRESPTATKRWTQVSIVWCQRLGIVVVPSWSLRSRCKIQKDHDWLLQFPFGPRRSRRRILECSKPTRKSPKYLTVTRFRIKPTNKYRLLWTLNWRLPLNSVSGE